MFRTSKGLVKCAVLAFLIGGAAAGLAQDRTIKIVVPAPAGGSLDASARALAERLTALTHETHVVENRPGANTVIGAEHVARAAPDGRVMLLAGTGTVLSGLMQKIAFSPLEELRPVVKVTTGHFVLVVPEASPLNSAQSLLAQASARQQGLSCAAPPGPMAIACEQLRARSNDRVTVVPYPGIAPALTALLGGHVDVMFSNVEATDKLVETGRLRVLAATSALAAPNAPLVEQVWPGLLMEGYYGLFVPARTPNETVQQINRNVNQVLGDPKFTAQMREAKQDPEGGTPEQFARTVARTVQRHAELFQKIGLTAK
jgi:tripartite-type tricarboxylate transporter receptor subunit TctC